MLVQDFTFGKDNFLIEAVFVAVGDDYAVIFAGGERRHIGAIAIGYPRLSLKNDGSYSASASVFCLSGHKEDMLARMAALELSKAFRHNVVVTVGIHIDNATPEAIGIIESHFKFLLEQIVEWGELRFRPTP